MLTITLGLKRINFALDHPSKEIALIRKIASYSANHYAFGITSVSFLIKMSEEKAFSAPLLQPFHNQMKDGEVNCHTLLLHR